jgi:PAS domain S-box-containing protein
MADDKGRLILLVEDEALIAMSEKLALEKYGYAVKTVKTGEQAIEAVHSSPEIDLVLMDINLGDGIDGTEAAAFILKDHDIPIVFVSSHTEPEIVEKTEKITSYGYVVKNSSVTVLDASIKMAFKLFDAKMLAQKKEKLIHEHEEKYRLLYENAGVSIGYYTPEGIILSYNHLAASHLGGVPEDFIGKSIHDLFPKADAEIYQNRMKIAASSDTPLVSEGMVPAATGSLYFLSTYTRILDAEGKLLGVQIISHDFTKNKQVEEDLKASKDMAEMLLNIAAEIIISEDFEGNILLLNESGHSLLGYEAPELIGKNFFDTCLPEEIRKDVGEYFKSLRDGELDAIVAHENEVITKSGERRMIHWHNAVIKDKKGIPTCLFSSGEDITERNRTDKELKESRERLRFALEVSGLGEWELDLRNNRMHRSDRWAGMLGYDISEIENVFQQGIDLQHPDDREAVRKAVQEHHEGRTDVFKVDYRMRTKDGRYKWIQDCGKIIERDEAGNPIRICGTHGDIDERKRSEELVKREQKRLQNVLDAMNAGTWEWNIQTGEAVADEASAKLLGYTLDELEPEIFKTWMSLKHPDDRDASNDLLMKHVRGEIDAYEYESRMKHKSGNWVWIQGFGKVSEWDAHGDPLRIFGTHIDITERKQNELALRESRERLLFALEGSELGEWDWNLGTNILKRNERWAGMLGYTLAELDENLQQGIDLQHPDDREHAWRAVQEHLDGKTGFYSVEYRMRTKNGDYKWIHDCGKIMERDGQGNPLRLCGTHADVDEQKKAEDRIRTLLAEKELILKEVHHRIKNNMNAISSLLSFQASMVEEPSAVCSLQDAGNRIQSMSLLYDKLYLSNDFSGLAVEDYLSTLVDEIASNSHKSQCVVIDKHIEDFMLDTKRLQLLGIIVNELLTNIMKHAFPGNAQGHVDVSAVKEDGQIVIVVQDDGTGLREGSGLGKNHGFGLQLVEALAGQLNGSIRMESGHGTKVVLEFPI